ncbi:MAG TPA: hypothetical protein VEB43_01835 [Anaeromyxobacter sp.]|nr:hypothetical protein [Anaeromyxobacter sp.]
MASLPVALALAVALAAGETSPVPQAEPLPGAPPPAQEPKAPAPERETTEVLLRRCMNAYGGSRARVRLGRVRATGKLSSRLHPGETGAFSRTFVRGRGVRIEVAFAGSAPEVQVLDGARAFRYGEPAPKPVSAALHLEAARLDLPALLEDREAEVQDQGEVEHEGHKLRVLGLELAGGARIEAGIDPKTGRILYARGLAQTGPRELELFTVFRDFRTVDGILVPFREEGYANGEATGDVVLSAVELLDEVAEGVFEP